MMLDKQRIDDLFAFLSVNSGLENLFYTQGAIKSADNWWDSLQKLSREAVEADNTDMDLQDRFKLHYIVADLAFILMQNEPRDIGLRETVDLCAHHYDRLQELVIHYPEFEKLQTVIWNRYRICQAFAGYLANL